MHNFSVPVMGCIRKSLQTTLGQASQRTWWHLMRPVNAHTSSWKWSSLRVRQLCLHAPMLWSSCISSSSTTPPTPTPGFYGPRLCTLWSCFLLRLVAAWSFQGSSQENAVSWSAGRRPQEFTLDPRSGPPCQAQPPLLSHHCSLHPSQRTHVKHSLIS